jgi:hypothetical protein
MSLGDPGATNVYRSPLALTLNHNSRRSFRRISTPPKEVKRICGPFVLNDGYTCKPFRSKARKAALLARIVLTSSARSKN